MKIRHLTRYRERICDCMAVQLVSVKRCLSVEFKEICGLTAGRNFAESDMHVRSWWRTLSFDTVGPMRFRSSFDGWPRTSTARRRVIHHPNSFRRRGFHARNPSRDFRKARSFARFTAKSSPPRGFLSPLPPASCSRQRCRDVIRSGTN